MLVLQTNYGPITIELDFEHTPKTAQNFLDYAKAGFYDDTIFHRVIEGFMIQGGGFLTDMTQKDPGKTIQNEAKHARSNKRGSIAMARTSDPHSASAQFFINVVDNNFLNFRAETQDGWGYCVFGKVTTGMEIVDKIKSVATTSKGGHQNVPVDPIVIEKVIVESEPNSVSA